jgi:hypothetical protein
MNQGDTGPVRARESRARRKIREAAERYGLTVGEVEYEPIGGIVEMQGPAGGWWVEIVGYGTATGFSWQEVVESIDVCAPLWLNGTLRG